MTDRIISYSVYGDNPRYTLNAAINCLLARVVYPGWHCRFYLDDTVPRGVVDLLRSFDHVEVWEMPRHTAVNGMLWRYLPAAEPGVAAMISRDADSWLSPREAVCVDAWLAGDSDLHLIIDHCWHTNSVMGGMLGARTGALPGISRQLDEYSRAPPVLRGGESFDSRFLRRLLPQFARRGLVHSSVESPGEVEIQGEVLAVRAPPPFPACREPVRGCSLSEAREHNLEICALCGQTHAFFVGMIVREIPPRALSLLRAVATDRGIATHTIPGLGQPKPRWVGWRRAVR